MKTIRKSLAMFIALTMFSLGLTGVAFAEEIDQEKMTELYRTMKDNVAFRTEELLSDYGMSFEEYERISQEVSRIEYEERRAYTDAVYGDYFEEQGLDYDSAVYLDSIERRYQGVGELQDKLPKEALEKAWADYLASFDPNEWTANYYKLCDWYNVKFDDGTLVRDYLPDNETVEEISKFWLDFLPKLTVDDHGYFTVILEDGIERRLLAGFGLKIWTFNDRSFLRFFSICRMAKNCLTDINFSAQRLRSLGKSMILPFGASRRSFDNTIMSHFTNQKSDV